MAKIKLISSPSIAEIFQDFIVSRRTKGLADKTLQSYQSQFKAISRHLNTELPIDQLNSLKENIDTTTPHGRFMLTFFGALGTHQQRYDSTRKWNNSHPPLQTN